MFHIGFIIFGGMFLVLQDSIILAHAFNNLISDIIKGKRDFYLWIIPFGILILLIDKIVEFYKTLD